MAGSCGRINFDKLPATLEDAGEPELDADTSVPIIIASGWTHVCAAIEGRVACWGEGGSGQLGQGNTASSATPLTVDLPGPARALAAGNVHSCALVEGDVYCWGDGGNGRLGNGDGEDHPSPVKVTGLLAGSVTSIAAANFSTCAVSQETAYCWGLNNQGQLGVNTVQTSSIVPIAVANLPAVDSVVASADRACALSGRTAYCWGHDHNGDLGTAGNGGAMFEEVVVVSQLSLLSLAINAACGIIDGGVQCWGNGEDGQLGDGAFTDSTAAVNVAGLGQDVTALHAAGGIQANSDEVDSMCAIQGGEAFCWGRNDFGQLGDQSTMPRGVPVPVVGLRGEARLLNGGTMHFCAVTEPGNIECWGRGAEGQLGNGTFTDSLMPVLVPTW
jgi:alpha-tubulin suppressor-like RCC1 family protein